MRQFGFVVPAEGGAPRSRDIAAGVSAMLIGVFGQIVFVTIPFFLSFVKQGRSFGDSQVSLISSADMGGMFLASLVATSWIRTAPWRVVAGLALIGLILLTLCSMVVTAFAPFAALRTLSGFASGSLMAIGMTAMGDRKRADAWFGCYLATLSVTGTVTAFLIPRVVQPFGLTGYFVSLVAIYLLLLPVCNLVPRYAKPWIAKQHVTNGSASIPLALLSLVAIHLFGMSIFSVWSHLPMIGQYAGLSPAASGDAMSLGFLLGIPASICAGLLAGRIPRIWLFAGLAFFHLLGLGLLVGTPGLWAFQTSTLLLAVGWSFGSPLQVGLTSSLDPTGRFVVLFVAAMKASYVVAGAALALLLLSGQAAPRIIIFSASSGGISLLCYMYLALRAHGIPGDKP